MLKKSAIIIVLAAGLAMARWAAADPAYEGRGLAEWTADLGCKDAETRIKAAGVIAGMGKQARTAAPLIGRSLAEDSEPAVRRCLAGALWRMGPEGAGALEALTRALNDSDAAVRRLAAEALGQMQAAGRPAIPALKTAVEQGKENRRVCLESLAAITLACQDKETVPFLIKYLPEAEWNTAAVIAGFGRDAAGAIPVFMEGLRQAKHYSYKMRICLALGEFGKDAGECLPILENLLRTENGMVRAAAGIAIEKINGKMPP